MKLVFDRDFDLEMEQEQQARVRLQNAKYTEDELEAARQQGYAAGSAEGYAKGHRAALDEAARDADVQRRATQTQIAEGLAALFAAADAHATTLEQQALSFALAVFEKVAPEMLDRRRAHRARQEVHAALKLALGSSSIRVFLPPDAEADGGAGIVAAARELGVGDRLRLIEDTGLALGAARVEWDNGFMEFSFDDICTQILTALREAAPDAASSPAADHNEKPLEEGPA